MAFKNILAYVFIAVLFAQVATGATRNAPAYLLPQVEQRYPWSEGIYVNLKMDENLCRKKYGDNWQRGCAANIGKEGEEIKGISLTPATVGRWVWQGANSLHFIPESPLIPDSNYKVYLKNLHLPASVKLSQDNATFRSLPLAAMLNSQKLWIDPSAKEAHVLTASVHFTSMAKNYVPQFQVEVESGLELAEPEYVWNATGDKVTMSAKVKKLPLNKTTAQIIAPGCLGLFIDDKGFLHITPNNIFQIDIRGRNNLFSIEELKIVAAKDENLNNAYELQIKPSLYARPEDVLKKLIVIQLPETLDENAVTPYNWRQAPAIPQVALNRGRLIKPVSLQADNSPVSKLSYRIDVDPGAYALVYLAGDLSSASGLSLNRNWREIIYINPQDAILEFLQPGNVLPLAGEGKLDIYSTDLTEIRWEAARIRDPFLALAAGNYNFYFNPQMYEDDLIDSAAIISRGTIPVASRTGQAQFSVLDLSPLLKGQDDVSGLMAVTLKGYKNKELQTTVSRMILVTDLGIIAKRSPTGAYDIFTVSLQKGEPASQAEVNVLGANGRPVATAKTDSRGYAQIPNLRGLSREQKPVAVIAELGRDLAWLPLNDSSLVTDYRSFNIKGRSLSPEGISSFVFSQRGIYRPGETLHFGIIARRSDWQKLPDELPLTAKLYSPAGKELLKQTINGATSGVADLNYKTDREAQTGIYRLDIELNGRLLAAAWRDWKNSSQIPWLSKQVWLG